MRCPPPGEGLARAPDLDLLSPPKSHSRDAVMWAESVAAREFTPNCFMSGDGKGADCMTRQTQAERQRAKLAMREYDYQKAQRNKPAPPPKPLGVGAGAAVATLARQQAQIYRSLTLECAALV
jgi:hypothetical protein